MDRDDPINQFFPGQEDVDLYNVMQIASNATQEDIKKAYRRLALIHHPDKHAQATDKDRAAASLKFQQIGFAYTVLGDEKRRRRYDSTGSTDDGFELGAGEDGWDAYFKDMFDKVTKVRLDELKQEYQDSSEELRDLEEAYIATEGSIEGILERIPHSNHTDEDRFIRILNTSIKKKAVPTFPRWKKDITDQKAKGRRKKAGEKEALEAEEVAKELGVWDEFYEDKKTAAAESTEEGEDYSALKALIQGKKKKTDAFFDSLASKYAEPSKGKRKAGGEGGRGKRSRNQEPPEIDEEEFTKLQKELFSSSETRPAAKKRRKARA